MIYLIRHAESTANIGEKTTAPGSALLSLKGQEQARSLVEKIPFVPDLVVVSPFIRTRLTAEPLIAKFPDVKVETWAIQEFSFLDSKRCNNTTHEERIPMAEGYFRRNDADYIDGEGAESFNQLMHRVRDMLQRLRQQKNLNIVVFSHGNFMRAVVAEIEKRKIEVAEFLNEPFIENTQIVDLTPYLF